MISCRSLPKQLQHQHLLSLLFLLPLCVQGNGLAFVHNKERVLTSQQNTYFEQLIAKLPELLKMVDITKYGGYAQQIHNLKNANSNSDSTVIQKVECIFPHITTTDGLQKAILELPRIALQKKK